MLAVTFIHSGASGGLRLFLDLRHKTEKTNYQAALVGITLHKVLILLIREEVVTYMYVGFNTFNQNVT